jgi:hypothetical protein
MKAHRLLAAVEIVFCSLPLVPALLSWQRPQAPGKLSVRSNPTGGTITIDSQSTGRLTDFTFVVSPGDHYVSVESTSLHNCAKSKSKKVSVPPGSVVSVNCTTSGWDEAKR